MSEHRDFPNIQDLSDSISFSPQTGRIRLYDQRMLLVHDFALGELRAEIIEAVGVERARQIYMRVGYYQGAADAALTREARNRDEAALFMAGPQLAAIQGWIGLDSTQGDYDWKPGHFHAEHLWPESIEAHSHVTKLGAASYPVCWQLAGYASGFTSEFTGVPILFREVECVAMGHKICRAEAKPLREWGDKGSDAEFLHVEPFVNAFAAHDLAHRGKTVRKTDEAPGDNTGIVGASAAFNAIMYRIHKVAATDTTVLLLGESGVGKEMFARAVHFASPRAERALVAVNCAAIPDSLIESELFGVEKGAFTGAVATRAGRFERADGGTLMLDEVGSLPFTAQGKLLRALQERVVERVGGDREIPVDVRVIAATNTDLRRAVEAGTFRDDLYYRLNVFPIEIPPLSKRRADIPLLMDHFLNRYRIRFGKQLPGFTEAAVDALYAYAWPGNIRELENMIERAAVLASDGESIDVHHLFTDPGGAMGETLRVGGRGDLVDTGAAGAASDATGLSESVLARMIESGASLGDVEDALLNVAIQRSGGNVSAAARLLGLSRSQLDYRVRRRNRDSDREP